MKTFNIGSFAVRQNCQVIGRTISSDAGGSPINNDSVKVTFNADIQSLIGTDETKNGDLNVQSSTHYASTDTSLSSVVNGDYFIDDLGQSYIIQYCEFNNTIVGSYWCLYLKKITN